MLLYHRLMQRAGDRLPLILASNLRCRRRRYIAFDGKAQNLLDFALVEALDRVLQSLERGDELLVRKDRLIVLEDARVPCPRRVLSNEKLLVQLLATPQPDIFDRDIAIGIGVVTEL